MFLLTMRYQVGNYAKWKAAFDEFPPSKGGATFHRVNRVTGNPNTVMVTSGFATPEAADAFVSNPNLVAAMQAGGAIGRPRVEIYEEVEPSSTEHDARRRGQLPARTALLCSPCDRASGRESDRAR